MPNTTNLSLPYPAASDNPGVSAFVAPLIALDALVGTWTDWSALLVVSQPAAIAKTVQVAKYRVINKECEFFFKCTATANGTAANTIVISGLPPTPAYTTLEMGRGIGCRDFTTQADQGILVTVAGGTNMNIRSATGIVNSQWAIGQILMGHGKFEVA